MNNVELTGITSTGTQQIENIRIAYGKLNNNVLAEAFTQLKQLTNCNNYKLSYDITRRHGYHDIIKLGRWDVYCYSNGLKLEECFYHTVNIPMIPYTDIKDISFDTFLDKSHLVGIWITLNNDTMYTVSTSKDY